MSKRFDRLKVTFVGEILVLSIRDKLAWNGSDLSLLRDALLNFADNDDRGAIGIELDGITYVPSGFFGMLYDFHDKGFAVHLFHPQEKVRNMLWFRHFFEVKQPKCYRLCLRPPRSFNEEQNEPLPATTVE